MNYRMLVPEDPRYLTRVANGRTYAGSPGAIVVVPDFDGTVLGANGWSFLTLSGPTTMRPSGEIGLYPALPGTRFFDETLSLPIVFDGVVWRNAQTDAVV